MEDQINIKHYGKSFRERKRYFLLIFLGLMFVLGIIHLVHEGIENIIGFISILGIIFGISIALNIIQTKLYLVDFTSDSNNIIIRYFNGSKEQRLETSIEKIDVKLKNTSSRSGFNCELKVTIEGLKFTIDDTFDWSLREIKQLFEYIKYHKQMSLTEADRFNISRIEEKLKKTSPQQIRLL
jgi:hypothetical protein